jgi:general secretion pathway protein D
MGWIGRLKKKEKTTMRIVKLILVGIILAAVIIPLPGHTAATGNSTQSPAPPTQTAPADPPQAEAAPADPPQTETSRNPSAPADDPPANPPQAAAPQPAPTPTSNSSSGPAVAQLLAQRPGPAPAAQPKPIEAVQNGGLKLKLNFQDTPLQTVLEYLSETAGLTIVSNEPIAASRITLIKREALPVKDAVELINTVLKEKGYNAILTGKILKVVTLSGISKENTMVLTLRDPNQIEPSDSVVTCVIPVAHVTAAALLQNLQVLLPEYATLTANADGNALILTDTKTNIRRLLQIVAALDTHMATVAEIRVFRLYNADATSVATLINSIFQQQAQSSRGFGSRGSFFGSGGPLQMMMQMRGRGGPGGSGGQGGPGGFDRSRGGSSSSQQGGGTVNVQVVAAADSQTNSVVVRGPAESLVLVENVVKALDETGAKVATVRVFQLRYADALNTADVINQLFNPQTSSSSRSSRSRGGSSGFPGGGPMMFRGPFGDGGPGGPGGPGDLQGEGSAGMVGVTAAADSRTNTVVVTGPESVLNVVEEVIKKLDSPLSNVADVKVFHLEYADASNTAQLINEVFGQSRTSSSSRSSRSSSQQSQRISFRGGPGGGFGGFGGMVSQGGDSGSMSDITVVASADTRTNSLVVSGPTETLEVIAQIIKELDENPAQERRIFVYPLKNATATSLMTILNNLFQEMQALNQRVTGSRSTTTGGARNAGGGGMAGGGMTGGGMAGGGAAGGTSTSSSSSDLSEETYFEADPNTNSLLIMTSSKNYDKVKPIIEELDKPVGQVLIKVLFAELTHTNDMDLGTEFAMLNLNRNGGTQTVDVFGRPLDLTTPGSATSALGPGTIGSTGLSIRTVQGALDVTLHALQETGKLNVLSRPYVLTRNNRMATITVADEVPIPSSSTNQGTIGTSTSFTYRNDIGIVLDVTPSINDDGLVNMIVSPKITTQNGSVQIAEGLNAVQFSTRSATTRVAVMDGQTIVIGGLIQDKTNDDIKKVPLLGDIPLIGNAFRRTVSEKSKIELLIFLTPYVAQEPKELTGISDAEERRSSLSTDKDAAEVYRRHMDSMRNRDLDPNRPQ